MKTAVSLPDAIFQSAEVLAERLGVSRSQLYANALAALAQHERAAITAKLNASILERGTVSLIYSPRDAAG